MQGHPTGSVEGYMTGARAGNHYSAAFSWFDSAPEEATTRTYDFTAYRDRHHVPIGSITVHTNDHLYALPQSIVIGDFERFTRTDTLRLCDRIGKMATWIIVGAYQSREWIEQRPVSIEHEESVIMAMLENREWEKAFSAQP